MNPNIPMNLNNMMNPNMNNMMNNLNYMMMNVQNNNMNKTTKEQILDLINQNMQMTEQISINNNMIKNMIENSDFENENKEKTNRFKDITEIDFFPGYHGQKINVIFSDTTGIKINIITPFNAKVKDLLRAFHTSLQIQGKYLLKIKIFDIEDYIFLYNNNIISLNDEKTIFDYGLKKNVEKIVFYQRNSIIGGKNFKVK